VATSPASPYERHASLGVNVHVLHALLQVPGYPEPEQAVRNLLAYIEEDQRNDLYWYDKWHISPYYATSHVACVLADLPPSLFASTRPMLDRTLDWLRQTQNADGSWGFYGQPTIEETAYAVVGLRALGVWSRRGNEDVRRAELGIRYINSCIGPQVEPSDELMPPLWIDKCLYAPRSIIRAAAMSALRTSSLPTTGRSRITSSNELLGAA
jgi:halimadienyl-diphosphate synthase